MKSVIFKIFLLVLLLCSNTFFVYSQIIPTNISGLAVWLKSDSGVVLSGSSVSKWNDVSGNNYVFNSIGATSNPNYITTTQYINNKPVLIFDGINDGLISNKKVILGNLGISIYVVAKVNSFTPYGMFLCYGVNSSGSWNFRLRPSEAKITLIDGSNNSGVGLSNTNTNDLTTSGYSIVNGSFDTGPSKWKISENSFAKDSIIQAFVPADSNLMTIGFRNDFAGYQSLNISEILVFNRALTDAENTQMINYLRNRYAPPVELGPQILAVCDTSILLNVGDNFVSTVWSNGSTNNTLLISGPDTVKVSTTDGFGFTSSDSIILKTFQNKFQFYTLNDTILCGNNIVWNTGLNNTNYNFLWSNGGLDSSLFITTPNTYFVQITDTSGCIETATANIQFDTFPSTASLGPDVPLCSGNSITLTSGALPSLTYTWSTGSTNDSLLISASGQYSVIVTNTNSCVAKDTINVTVLGQAPTANFSSNVGCLNSAVLFTNLSIPPTGNTIDSTIWDFGDSLSVSSNTSTSVNPSHTYTNTGTYTVTLKVITDAGCEQSIAKIISIAPTPTVNFTSGISCQNDSTAFSSSIITSPGYSVTSLSWNFGDPGLNNTSSLASPKHLFSIATNYNVKLVVTNNAGCKDSITKSVNVKAQVTASFTNSPPCSNTATIFQDNSIAPPLSTRLWSFGTNTIGGLTAIKTFTSSGVYSVTLTVTGTNLCTSTITKQIIVFLPPAANFTIPTFCSKDTVTATNQSSAQSGIISSYNWKLNNTVFSTAQNPTLTAISAGTYSVRLTVVNSFSCKDSITKPITVLPLPNVDFTTNPLSYYFINSPVTFTPTITNASSYLWNITGVPTTTVQSPTVSFSAEGSYTVSLYLQDIQGCKNLKSKTIIVSKRYLDIAVLNVNTTKDNDGFITVEADVANYGSVPVTSFDIHYQISDAGNIKETWNGTLNPNAFYVYTFIAKSASPPNNSNNITCVEIEKANGVIDENTSNNNLCNTLNTNEISVSNPIPNPTDGDITLPIILNKDIDFTIAIYNSTGQIVYEETTQKGIVGLNFVTLPTSTYARGCYIIKTIIDDKIFIKKFIKIGNK